MSLAGDSLPQGTKNPCTSWVCCFATNAARQQLGLPQHVGRLPWLIQPSDHRSFLLTPRVHRRCCQGTSQAYHGSARVKPWISPCAAGHILCKVQLSLSFSFPKTTLACSGSLSLLFYHLSAARGCVGSGRRALLTHADLLPRLLDFPHIRMDHSVQVLTLTFLCDDFPPT